MIKLFHTTRIRDVVFRCLVWFVLIVVCFYTIDFILDTFIGNELSAKIVDGIIVQYVANIVLIGGWFGFIISYLLNLLKK